MNYALVAIALVLAAPAAAQTALPPDKDGTVYIMPRIPSEADKKEALMLAWTMNGGSMVGRGASIDLTQPVTVGAFTGNALEVLAQIRSMPPKK